MFPEVPPGLGFVSDWLRFAVVAGHEGEHVSFLLPQPRGLFCFLLAPPVFDASAEALGGVGR